VQYFDTLSSCLERARDCLGRDGEIFLISHDVLKCTGAVESVVKRIEKDFTLTYFLRRRFLAPISVAAGSKV
jgi:hypothetical protein